MKNFILGFILLLSFNINAQTYRPVKGTLSVPSTFNFTQKANTDTVLTNRALGVKPNPRMAGLAINKDSIVSRVARPIDRVKSKKFSNSVSKTVLTGVTSPSYNILYNSTIDDSTIVPSDVNIAVNSSYVVQTNNQEINIYSKSGAFVSKISTFTFFSSDGKIRDYYNPRILYDESQNRWIGCIGGYSRTTGYNVITLVVSATSDPTGNWYSYSLNASNYNTSASDFVDYPQIGYNKNWVVITANIFKSTGNVEGKTYVLNKASLYGGLSSNLFIFTDAYGYGNTPAETKDTTQTTEYLVQNWNGNSGGYGYIRVCKITGTVNSPTISVVNQIGVAQTWSDFYAGAVQKGGSEKLEIDGAKIGNVIYINNSLWFAQNVFLPTTSPTRSAIQWWQINPATPSITQFGRIEEPDTTSSFFFFPNISVNISENVLISHGKSSSNMYASACYSMRSSSDSTNYTRIYYPYKLGTAYYYKDLGTGRNRWGNYFGSTVDPVDNSFWVTGSWANTNNKWYTSIANISSISAAAPCSTVTGLASSNIADNSATLSWTSAPSVTSYNVFYRLYQNGGWSSVASATNTLNLSGLTSGTRYEWKVQSVCSGNSSFSDTSSFTTTSTCSIPSTTSPTSITPSSFVLNWGAVGGASSYNVKYRIQTIGSWTTTSTNTNSLSVSNLTPATTYEYQVQTVCSGGNSSSFSNLATVTTSAIPCNAPASLTTSNITSSSTTLGWAVSTNVLKYIVRYKIQTSNTWTLDSSVTNSLLISNLAPATTYEFQVQTSCTNGYSSSFSNSSTFTTTAACNVPSSLGPTLITTTSATYSWGYVVGASSYNFRFRIYNSSDTWTVVNSTTNYVTVSNLTPGTSYECQLQSVCSPSLSSNFTGVLVFTTNSTCSLTPTPYSTPSSITSTSVTLNWGNVQGANGYNIQYRLQNVSTWTTVTSNTNSVTISNLTPANAYFWRVQIDCGNGQVSNFSSSYSFTTLPLPCDTPTTDSPSQITTNSIILNWIPVVFGNTFANAYNIRYRIQNTSTWTTTTSSTNSVTISNLTPATTYEYQVQTNCGNGNLSSFSNIDVFTTNALSCSSPGSVTINQITATSAVINFQTVVGAQSYEVYYRKLGITSWIIIPSVSTTVSLLNLVPSTQYEYQVRSKCFDETFSNFSNSNIFTTLYQCNTPTSLSNSSVTTNSVTISWNSISNAVGYNIRYKPDSSNTWISTNIPSNTNILSLSLLNPGTTYIWQVQTDCGSGRLSDWSSNGSFTTLFLCNAPNGLSTTDVINSPYSKTLNWNQAYGYTSYNIRYRIVGSSTWINTLSNTQYKLLESLSIGSYEWQVQTDCGSGRLSSWSLLSSFNILDPCSNAISGLTANVDVTSATLVWQKNSFAISYNIRYKETGTTTWTSLTSSNELISISNLKFGTSYEYQVQAICNFSTTPFSSSYTFITRSPCDLFTPVSPTITSITSKGATLNCLSLDGAISYTFRYRKTSTTTWTTVTSNTNLITISNLESLTNYECQVQIACTGSVSNWSGSKSFITLQQFTCIPTPSIYPSQPDSYYAWVYWDTVPGASYYKIRYKIFNTSTWLYRNTPIQTSSFYVPGNGRFYDYLENLTPSSTYIYNIQTICTDGTSSAWSHDAYFTTTGPCSPPPPALTINPGYSSIDVSWSRLGSGLYDFVIFIRPYNPENANVSKYWNWGTPTLNLDGENWTGLGTAFDLTSFTAQGYYDPSGYNVLPILPNTEYEMTSLYVCGSRNSGATGASDFGPIVRFKTLPSPCSTPTLTATSITTNSVNLNLGDATGAAGYKIQYREKNVPGYPSGYWGELTSSSNNNNITFINDIQPGYTYIFRAQKICSNGTSLYSDTIQVSPIANTIYVAPTGLVSSNVTTTGATVSWTPVSGAISYRLHYEKLPTIWTGESGFSGWPTPSEVYKTISVNSTSYTFTGLPSWTDYNWGVQAVYSNGNVSPVNLSTFTTLSSSSTKANLSPTGITVNSVFETGASITYTPVTSATASFIRWKKSGTINWQAAYAIDGAIGLQNLLPNTSYDFQLACAFGITNSEYSSWTTPITFTTAPTSSGTGGTCSNPTNLNPLIGGSSTSLLAAWSVVPGAVGYRIWFTGPGYTGWNYRDITNLSPSSNFASTPTICYYILDGLQPSSTYRYSIQSICSDGITLNFNPDVNTITMTISSGCSTPVSLSTNNITSTSANLGWSKIIKVDGYNVRYRVIGTNLWTYVMNFGLEVELCPLGSCTVLNPNNGQGILTNAFSLSGLSSNTNYEFQVIAGNTNGYSGWSTSKTFKTLP